MNDRETFRDRFRYWLDNTFSRGTAALIAWLGIISAAIIVVAATVLSTARIPQSGSDQPITFWEAAWEAMMRTLDAGTMGGDVGWRFRLVMFCVTIGGVFIISSLIGVLSSGLERRMEELRKGRSRVIEHDHTIILGWSPQVFTVLDQLTQANSNHTGRCVVILGPKDKIEMEDEIAGKVPQTGIPRRNRTRVVCRTGSAIDASDLFITNFNAAKAIVVLSPEKDGDYGAGASHQDAEVIKTVLAILNHPNRRKELFHIVAELRDPHNFSVAQVIGKNEVEWILVGNLVARIMAQACRQSNLSEVYNELLAFEGNEIYNQLVPQLTGLTFGEALLHFEHNVLIGLVTPGGKVLLNPPSDTRLQSTDPLILIAEDDDQVAAALSSGPGPVEEGCIQTARPRSRMPERTLVLGWNWLAPTLLREMDMYTAPGSELVVIGGQVNFEVRAAETLESLNLKNQALTIREADITDRSLLESLHLGRYHHVIVLSNLEDLTPQQADARTLITLLHLRDLADKNNWKFSLTSEILDVRNRSLATVTRADDLIISDHLVSLILSQVAEEKELNAIFDDLFRPDGSEIYLKPVEDYVPLGRPVNFYTISEAARRQRQVAIGYRTNGNGSQGLLKLNPPKSEMVIFHPGDRMVVLAEN